MKPMQKIKDNTTEGPKGASSKISCNPFRKVSASLMKYLYIKIILSLSIILITLLRWSEANSLCFSCVLQSSVTPVSFYFTYLGKLQCFYTASILSMGQKPFA